MQEIIKNYIDALHQFFNQTKTTDLSGNQMSLTDGLSQAAELIAKANFSGNKVMFIGNGGSAAVSSHKALDYWMTGKIRGLAFSDPANLTCISNDFGYENVFAKQIEMFANKGDVLIAISSSGQSENIVLASEVARRLGCLVFTFSGFKETNRLRALGDLNFYVPAAHYNQVESLHLLLCDCILEIITRQRKSFAADNERQTMKNETEIIKDYNLNFKKYAAGESQKDILVVLDRDGTLIHDPGYFGLEDNWQDNLKFYAGAKKMIKELNRLADVIVATNQIGVARGYFGPDRVKEINSYLDAILRKGGAIVDGWYFSPFAERRWAEEEGLDSNSQWLTNEFPETRKPKTGMIRLAVNDLGGEFSAYKKIFAIGDSLDDLNLALNVNGIGVWFDNGKNSSLMAEVEKLKLANPQNIFSANELAKVVEIVASAT